MILKRFIIVEIFHFLEKCSLGKVRTFRLKCYNFEQAHSDEGNGDPDANDELKDHVGVDTDEIFENDYDEAVVVVVVVFH